MYLVSRSEMGHDLLNPCPPRSVRIQSMTCRNLGIASIPERKYLPRRDGVLKGGARSGCPAIHVHRIIGLGISDVDNTLRGLPSDPLLVVENVWVKCSFTIQPTQHHLPGPHHVLEIWDIAPNVLAFNLLCG